MTLGRAGGSRPLIELYLHPDHLLPEGFGFVSLEKICVPALDEVMGVARDGSPLRALEEIEITLVSDAVIADVHAEFMQIDEPTDVITFDHGEILVSTDTAAVQAVENQNSLEKETATYIVHGLLHLAGYADKAPEDFDQMAKLQQSIVDRVWLAA